ncbi:ferric reductase like transmembrane component [Colletotrichum graminicola]|uniref:Ferric reductase like transmembrane component n=1 Tax=Colletotrichum graminicola (strain M1.001 / M2 / FGSC 10212) TaxID=645133 RepID=E3QT47_COLGM|nr:ferric reductase like transmembrane component [Colletotrichum graminicola M1.001]EFQ34035.1 ferric reductase like transmembrane component [Colletotrichum graminicola M1.001]WDK20802.1 ferric reductase like transmembrane component [Colletotrichum graminicola]
MDFNLKSQMAARHIQDFSDAASLEPHWGYSDRVVPCTNDAGSCAYLDVVYGSHDLGMLYSGILWIIIGGILLVWAVGRRALPSLSEEDVLRAAILEDSRQSKSFLNRLRQAISSGMNRYLLPDFIRPIFGRTTRLQVLILAVLSGYLLIFSFVGIVYNTWITPVKNMPGVYNTRVSLGPWADRIGILAYALTPLAVLFASRESILSLLTGVPYQNFNFLHRWLGYIIVIQSVLHTVGWLVIEVRLYQPQPKVAVEWITQLYMIWGCIALFFILALYVLSLPPVIRLTGYEFFRKSHYVLAMLYVGACIGHWNYLECFMIPALIIWFLDRAARAIRTALVHHDFIEGKGMGFSAAQAGMVIFPDSENGDVIRLDFSHPHDAWSIGQHFYLCFTESSIWQSHPFTPLNVPITVNGRTKHSYIFRAKSGETKKVAEVVKRKLATVSGDKSEAALTTSVILTGPYGDPILRNVTSDVNILCVAGGTGVTYVLPALMSLRRHSGASRKLELVWVVRHTRDIEWIRPELDLLEAEDGPKVVVRIFATRDASSPVSSPRQSKNLSESGSTSDARGHSGEKQIQMVATPIGDITSSDAPRHPDMTTTVRQFVDATISGRTAVFASGPGGLISDIRVAVAQCNSVMKVWRGEERYNVSLIHDERMER